MTITRNTLGLALLLGAPGFALAQEPPPPAPSSGTQVEEIVVTANRREERLQDVPVSVSAVTGASLEKAGISDTRQLTQMMPALVFSRANTSFQPYIRGVGTRNANTGDESNVSVYIDGVYQPVMASLGFDLMNVQRVEVLRGPQGTLFGRNSTGGLINIITRDPSHDFSGRVVLRAGNFGERSFQSYTTGGLSDTLAADLSLYAYGDDGFIKDRLRGGHVGERYSYAVRSKLMWEPNDKFRATLTGAWSDSRDASSVNNQPLNGNTSARAANPVPAIIPTKPWESALDRAVQAGSKQKSLDLQMRYAFDNFNLESTSSVQRNRALSETDNDGTTKPVQGAVVHLEGDYWSHEVRALSTTGGPFTWITGAYFFGGTGKFNPLLSYANNAVALTGYTSQHVTSWAGFAEGTYEFDDHWRLTAGARYTEEKRNYQARTISAAGAVTLVPRQNAKFDQLTYRASLQYRFSEDANVYASYSRGFKSGVFNGFATSVAAAAPTRPELLDAYEVGLKADPLPWLRTNLSIFHYDYTDIQQSARSPTGSLILLFNAASAKVDGGELEVTIKATPDLNIRAYATYLDGKYDSFPTAQIFVPRTSASASPCPIAGQSPCGDLAVAPYDASGKDMIRAPHFTFGTNFDYTRETEVGVIGVSGNIFYSAKYYWDFDNRMTQPSYTLVSGEVSWAPSPDSWKFSVWGRNLLNEVVYAQMLSSATGDVVGFERPRSYGVSVSKSF